MTAASFALLQSFLYLFSARIGCRGSRKYAHFRFALSRKSRRTRGGITARAANLSLPAMVLGADWLSGLPKKPITFVPLRAASPVGRAAASQRVLQNYLYLPWLWARICCRTSRKNAHFRSALSRKRTRRAAELQRVLCFFLYRHSVLRELAVGLPDLDYAVSEHGVGNL